MKEKKRFNIIDVMIIICAVLIILATVFRAQVISFLSDGENLSEFTVSFESEPIMNSYSGYVVAGKAVEWVEKDKSLGTIRSIDRIEAAKLQSIGADGKFITIISDTSSVIKGTLSIKAADKNGCFVSGTEFIGAGMKLTLQIPNVVFTVNVISVEKA